MIKILVVDDHKLFRDGVMALLSRNEDFEVLDGVSNGKELLARLAAGMIPDIVLLDITMPEMDGFEVLEIAKRKFSDIRFIAISMHDEGQYIIKSIRSGAYGYLLKNADEEELTKAIYEVSSGKKYFNQHVSDIMINNMVVEGPEPRKLSERELEVLKLVSEGKTTKEIAEELIVSTRTIETHRVNMMKKLDVQNSAELIRKALVLKLI